MSWAGARSPCILLMAAAGCTSPGQYGGPIPVDQVRFGARFAFFCRVVTVGQPHGHCPDDVPVDSGVTGGNEAEDE
jgi:hypothetical protein